jgi:capsular exopolysaccharide synthesis family protein
MNEFERFKDDEVDLLDVINKLKTLVFSNITTLIIGFISILLIVLFYLFSTPKEYNTFAKIKILEEQETSAFVLDDIMNFDSPFKNEEVLENEIEILKSKNILESVIDQLRITHRYSKRGVFRNSYINYDEIPFIANISKSDDAQEYVIKYNSESKLSITNINKKTALFSFNKAFVLENDTIIINKSSAYNQINIGEEYTLNVNNAFNTFLALKENIKLLPITDAVLQLSIKGKDPVLNTKIIQTLLNTYNSDGIADNKIIAESTSSFLKDRTKLIKTEILLIETTLSNIKKNNNVFDISAINSIFSSQKLVTNEVNFEIETQELLATSFAKKLKAHNNTDLLPLPIEVGIQNSELSTFTNQFNNLVIERNKLLKGRTIDNPEIILLNNQLSDLLSNLNLSVNNYIKNIQLKKGKINDYDSNLESEFYKLNETELAVVRLKRELEVKASILLFLLEKQEENYLSLAIESPTFKILDSPHTDYNTVSPNNKNTSIIGLFLALFLPLIFIFIKSNLYTKITNIESLKNKLDTEIPVLGEIPLTNQTLIQENIRGSLVESFRLIRTNLNYILPKNESGKVILVTSSIKGEGKTFAAINLAQSLSSINNAKVLAIGVDLRNPQIHRYINQDKDSIIGLTNYLNEKDIDYKEIITNSPDLNFDFILSGPIPPNAAEILLNSKLGLLIEKVKKDYDFVILDSAPCLLVSDTLGIMNLVDSTLYLTKANHTDLKLIEYINHLSSDKIIKNLSVVLNGVSTEGMQYNYGYGYGYDKEV